MKEPWSSRWYCSLLPAIAPMLGLTIVVVMIVEAVAGHTVEPASRTTWRGHLDGVDDALSRSDVHGSRVRSTHTRPWLTPSRSAIPRARCSLDCPVAAVMCRSR